MLHNSSNLSGAVEAETISKHGASSKSQMSRGNILKKMCVALSVLNVMFYGILFTGCSKPTPVDVNADNLDKHLSAMVNQYLDRALTMGVIRQYQQGTIQTSTESFKSIVQQHVAEGAMLHPNLTYNIKYLGGTIFDDEKQCEAMAYSFVKDGKLYGGGVVFSEAISRSWSSIWTIGYNSKDSGVNWPVWIGFILLMVLSPWLIRTIGRFFRSGY